MTDLFHVYQRRDRTLIADATIEESGALRAALTWVEKRPTQRDDLLRVHPIRTGGEFVYKVVTIDPPGVRLVSEVILR